MSNIDKVIGQSVFTMEDVNVVLTMDINTAKTYAANRVEEAKGLKPKNAAKAKMIIRTARTPEKLAFAMSSWILAHPSEGLKVIHAER